MNGYNYILQQKEVVQDKFSKIAQLCTYSLLCPESGTALPENQGNAYFRYQNDASQLPPKIPQKMWYFIRDR